MRAVFLSAAALCEALLCAAAARSHGPLLAGLLCALLSCSAGLFSASTALLPSSFSMTLLCAASAAVLARRTQLAVALCTAGPLLGWPFAGLAAVPLGLLALRRDGFLRTALSLAASAAASLSLSLAADLHFYGRPTVRPPPARLPLPSSHLPCGGPSSPPPPASSSLDSPLPSPPPSPRSSPC